MFRLFKLCVAMAAFVAFAWFGTTFKLGQLTLFQHLRAIGQSQESRELVDGTKQAAEPLVDGVRRRIASGTDKSSDKTPEKTPPTAPQATPDDGEKAAGAPVREKISPADKRQLRKVIAEHR